MKKLYTYVPLQNTVLTDGLLYAVIRHYLLVLKDGYLPPRYLTLEKGL